MSFSKKIFTNLLRIYSNIFTKNFLVFYFLKKSNLNIYLNFNQ
jgi:hypothetical protein